jgi:hypothetical protein
MKFMLSVGLPPMASPPLFSVKVSTDDFLALGILRADARCNKAAHVTWLEWQSDKRCAR